MALLFLTLFVLFPCLSSLTAATATLSQRMTFTDRETTMKRLPLPGHDSPVEILLEGEADTVIIAGKKHLNSFNFQSPQKTPREIRVLWTECIDDKNPQQLKADCNYNITVVHQREEANQVFLCGTNSKETLCCDMNLNEQQPSCLSFEKMDDIKRSIRKFVIKEGEPYALVDSPDSDLFITYSGSQEFVGIHKFGKHRVVPARHNKEQHYVGLVHGRQTEPLNSKVYAFYREKNSDKGVSSGMWLPFVTRVCTADRGGRKNILQFSWTSQMNARLFCGDEDSKQYFSELVDVATVHAKQWLDTRVYALFRNEWGMSAVCVYTIQDIEHIFTNSPLKGSEGTRYRPRECDADSTQIPQEVLMVIEKHSEMEQWVQPVNNAGPLLSNHHSYTHIQVHGSPSNSDSHNTVLFLSLNNGGVHKVMQNESQTFVIAEYQPFNHRAHIVSIRLHPTSKKLYVSSRNELVQLNVANCAHYGDSCELCVLARDPYCGWNGTHCIPETHGTLQELTQGNHAICASTSKYPAPSKAMNVAPDI
ncbi:semaphorin-7A isoform X2 [Anoplopoma fimbria]|uniref:semaphorin-7A isoform X2 n=1 Tax=Anoplopoma fimbria TaxID=229290 RepID=UPI0023EDEB28|nr:semaphorin-7A isoform X2 [Anoplopoma fimbria]